MFAKHYWPEIDYTWEDLDLCTAKAKDLWTWPMAGSLWMQKKGVEIIDIETFNYDRFITEKGDYLISFYGKEAGDEQIKHSNINQELNYAKEFAKKVAIQNRVPTNADITKLLDLGFLLICCINANALNKIPGYVGHFVVITGYDQNKLYLQDPGLPDHENRKVSYDLFEKSWAYPDENVKNILAFRLNR